MGFRGATVARKPNTLEVARSTLAGIKLLFFFLRCRFFLHPSWCFVTKKNVKTTTTYLADAFVWWAAAGDQDGWKLLHADVGCVQAHRKKLALYHGPHFLGIREAVHWTVVVSEMEEAQSARRGDLHLLEIESDLAAVACPNACDPQKKKKVRVGGCKRDVCVCVRYRVGCDGRDRERFESVCACKCVLI